MNDNNFQFDKRDVVRIAFERHVDRFCNVMEQYNCSNPHVVKAAMMYAFDQDSDLRWFGPNTFNADINIKHFCRCIYHLFCNGFFRGSSCCGTSMTIEKLSHIILAHDTCDKDADINPEKLILDNESYRQTTILSYMKADTCIKSFESTCRNLIKENFSANEQ